MQKTMQNIAPINKMRLFNRVVLGISGGVDSAVAALLLKEKGYNVLGAFMKNWDITDETGYCTSEKDYEDAQWVCDKLNIPLVQINFVKEYWSEVFSYTLEKYQTGSTPNPDILCNRNIKFTQFLNIARDRYNADAIATGHYARSSFGSFLEHFSDNTRPKLLRGLDHVKDQTFFLCQIPPDALKYTMFPLGDYKKSDVKQIAQEAGLTRIVKKKESMGICFIGKREFQNFIGEYIIDKPGNFVDIETGQIVGNHKGIHHYTIGQRCKMSGYRHKYYILHKDLTTNDIFVGFGRHPALFTDILYVNNPHWFTTEVEEHSRDAKVLSCHFRFQHTKPLIPCTMFQTSRKMLIVHLERPTRAITRGQFACFYKGEECLGGGEISSPGPSYYVLKKAVDPTAI